MTESEAAKSVMQANHQLKQNRHLEARRSFWIGIVVFLLVLLGDDILAVGPDGSLQIVQIIVGLSLGISFANVRGLFPLSSGLNTRAGMLWMRLTAIFVAIAVSIAIRPEVMWNSIRQLLRTR